jgi:xylulokinase
MAHFLTFDLGTTYYKVALVDETGHMVALERVQPPQVPYPGTLYPWEVQPAEFKRALREAVSALRSRVPDRWETIVALSFASQANTFLLLEADDQPITNLILWTNQASAVSDELHAISSHPEFRMTTGMPQFGPNLGLAKVLEISHRHAELFARARRFCYLSDYFTLWLTGRHCSEAGIAALSGALDVRTLRWWLRGHPHVLAGWLPEVVRAGTDLGPIAGEAADELGLPAGCRFIVGCLDQYASAIGTGTVTPGGICETTGTVLAAVRLSDRFEERLAPEVYEGPAFDLGGFFQMSFSNTSANLLGHYRDQLPGKPPFEGLIRLAASADRAGDVVIEEFKGSRFIDVAFRNVRKEHTPGQVVRAIFERVALTLANQVEHLCKPGERPAVIRSAGGAARIDLWLQIKADTLGTTFEAVDCEEPTSLGAAMLAARAVTARSMSELAREWVRVRKTFTPSAGN